MDSLYGLSAPTSVNDLICNVDETTKVFTALGDRSKKNNAGYPDSTIRGVQYKPASDGGAGTWSNIDASAGYTWSYGKSSQLYKFKDSTGGGTLMQAYIGSMTSSFYVSAMDVASSMMNQNPAAWTFKTTDTGYLYSIAFANNILYGLGSSGSNYTLTAITLSSASTQAPPASAVAFYNASTVQTACGGFSYSWMTALDKTLVIMCRSTTSTDKSMKVFRFDGTTFTAVPSVSGGIDTPIALTAVNTATPFLFMADSKGLYSIPFSGGWNGQNLVNVSDSIFNSNSPSSPSSTSPGSDSLGPDNGTRSSILIGVVCAVAALILLIALRVYIRKRRRNPGMRQNVPPQEPAMVYYPANTANTAAAPYDLPVLPVEPDIAEESVPQYYGQVPAQQPYSPYPASLPAYQSPPAPYAATPLSQPWQPQEPTYPTHSQTNLTTLQEMIKKENEAAIASSVPAPPRAPAGIIVPGAPQALPPSAGQLPGPQAIIPPNRPHTDYHDGYGAPGSDQQPYSVVPSSSAASTPYVHPPPTAPGAPQYR